MFLLFLLLIQVVIYQNMVCFLLNNPCNVLLNANLFFDLTTKPANFIGRDYATFVLLLCVSHQFHQLYSLLRIYNECFHGMRGTCLNHLVLSNFR